MYVYIYIYIYGYVYTYRYNTHFNTLFVLVAREAGAVLYIYIIYIYLIYSYFIYIFILYILISLFDIAPAAILYLHDLGIMCVCILWLWYYKRNTYSIRSYAYLTFYRYEFETDKTVIKGDTISKINSIYTTITYRCNGIIRKQFNNYN